MAIGEIGLDNYHKDVPIEQQIMFLKPNLIGQRTESASFVHNREADRGNY